MWRGNQNHKKGGAGSVLNSRSEFNRCYIPRLKIEEQDKIRELEKLEKQELESTKNNLLEGDRSWEQTKNSARSRAAKDSMKMGSSTKRCGAPEGTGRRVKRLKCDIVEDNWARKEMKTTLEGAVNSGDSFGAAVENGAEGLLTGGANVGYPNQPKGTSDDQCNPPEAVTAELLDVQPP